MTVYYCTTIKGLTGALSRLLLPAKSHPAVEQGKRLTEHHYPDCEWGQVKNIKFHLSHAISVTPKEDLRYQTHSCH